MTDFGSVRFFRTKIGSNRFDSVFSVWFGLLGFGSVFFQFFFGLGSVRFGFFCFRLIKPKPNQTGRFFQNFNRINRIFFIVRFFQLFFLQFSRFNQFSQFFTHPPCCWYLQGRSKSSLITRVALSIGIASVAN